LFAHLLPLSGYSNHAPDVQSRTRENELRVSYEIRYDFAHML